MNVASDPRPLAREDDVVVQELADEVLVYDLETHKAHCLNKTAALVWRHCDGETSVPQIAAIASKELTTPVDDDFVWLALARLQKANLLQNRVRRPGGMSRRDAMKWATAAAVPLVMSITARTASAQGSAGAGGGCTPRTTDCQQNGVGAGLCSSNAQCCSCCCHSDSGDPSDAHCAALSACG